MGYIYSDPTREDDPYALPNIEVFEVDYFLNTEMLPEESRKLAGSEVIGWYWQACFQGCLPDGDPIGPYKTEQEAIDAAREE